MFGKVSVAFPVKSPNMQIFKLRQYIPMASTQLPLEPLCFVGGKAPDADSLSYTEHFLAINLTRL